MKNFKDIWKNKAQNKNISSSDMITHCILKTIAAKSENKEEVLKHYLNKAFTPGKICQHRRHPYIALQYAAYAVENDLKFRQWIMGKPVIEFVETAEEIELFGKLMEVAKNYGRM